MEREPPEEFEWEDTTVSGGAIRSLEELCHAFTPDQEEEQLIRRHRGAIVLGVLGAAFWIGVAGLFVAATREGPASQHALGVEPVAAAPAVVAIKFEPRALETKTAAPPAKLPKEKAHPK